MCSGQHSHNLSCAGHSGPVRSVYVQDSEHCFLSASKDKTVKLWSLSNHGDGTAQSASSWTYYRHTRPVFYVGMVESVRQNVSCDGSLHVSQLSLSPGQAESQVDTSWELESTCDSVWPGLACTCVELGWLAHILVEIKFSRKSKQVFYRLATQPKSTQLLLANEIEDSLF